MALQLGLTRRSAAAEFVFLVGVPTMFAARGYALLEMFKKGQLGNENWTDVGVAFVAAAVTGFIVVKWLLNYVSAHGYALFAWWRIIVGTLALLALAAGM